VVREISNPARIHGTLEESTMRVVDLTGRRDTTSLQVEAGPSYEFLISLCSFSFSAEQDTLESWPEWFDSVRTKASSRLLSALQRIGMQAGKMWVNFVGLATQPPATREVPALLERIESLSPIELRLYLLGYHVPAYQLTVTQDVLLRAAEGDPTTKDRLLQDPSYFSGEADPFLRPLLSLDVDQTRMVALEALHLWYQEVFQPTEARVRAILERDAEQKRNLMGTVADERVIELASGIQYVAKPDIRQVFLIPQLAVRPWVLLCEHDDARLFCYPVADESSADETDPPPRLLRLHKALADEKRLRMLRALTVSSATLQELADRFGLPKSTAHHHLAILRTAGLVRMSSELERRHSVRFEALPELCDLLNDYLGAPAEGRSGRVEPHQG
jgi:DNA-binding transcriptional ArsR family regulator